MNDPIVELINRQIPWSLKTFGPGKRTLGVCNHIREELLEIEMSPGDLDEWIDVLLLAFDGAWRSGASSEEITDALITKQMKNINRKWEPVVSQDVHVKHLDDSK